MADNPYFISSQLPFGNAGAGLVSSFASGVPGSIGPQGQSMGSDPVAGQIGQQYASAYQQALAMNQSNYQNIIQGYQQTLATQQSAQQGIQNQYGALSGQVLGDIAGIGASQHQAIQDAYAQQQGGLQQSLISRGLGNTTVADSLGRGAMLDRQKAEIALANQMAQLTAGYRSQLGQAGLNYANQANMQNTALANQQLQFMNTVQSPYPNAALYGQLLGQRGQAVQSQYSQQLAAQQAGQQAAARQQAMMSTVGAGGGGSSLQSMLGRLGAASLGSAGVDSLGSGMASVTPFGMPGMNSTTNAMAAAGQFGQGLGNIFQGTEEQLPPGYGGAGGLGIGAGYPPWPGSQGSETGGGFEGGMSSMFGGNPYGALPAAIFQYGQAGGGE